MTALVPRGVWLAVYLGFLLVFLPPVAVRAARDGSGSVKDSSFPADLAASLMRVMEATDEQPAGSCNEPQNERDLLVLRRSKTVEGTFYEGECLERRGDLLGAMRAWRQASEPGRYGLRRLTSEPYPEGAAGRLREVAPTIPRLQPWEYLPAGALVRIHGWGSSSSCSQPAGCELPSNGQSIRVNPGRYTLTLYPLGDPAGFKLGPEFRLKVSDRFSIPEAWLVDAHLRAGNCRALERHGAGRGAGAVAECYSRQGDVTSSARWWQGLLLWADAQAERGTDEPLRAELAALKQQARRSLRGLPSLKILGRLSPGVHLLLKGRIGTAAHVSCAAVPCRLKVGSETALALGDYTLSLHASGHILYEQELAITAAQPKRSLTLPSPKALIPSVQESQARNSLLTIGYAGLGLAGMLGLTALATLEVTESRAQVWPWAIAADALAITSGAFLVYLWLEPSGPEKSVARISGGCKLDGCAVSYGRHF